MSLLALSHSHKSQHAVACMRSACRARYSVASRLLVFCWSLGFLALPFSILAYRPARPTRRASARGRWPAATAPHVVTTSVQADHRLTASATEVAKEVGTDSRPRHTRRCAGGGGRRLGERNWAQAGGGRWPQVRRLRRPCSHTWLIFFLLGPVRQPSCRSPPVSCLFPRRRGHGLCGRPRVLQGLARGRRLVTCGCLAAVCTTTQRPTLKICCCLPLPPQRLVSMMDGLRHPPSSTQPSPPLPPLRDCSADQRRPVPLLTVPVW